MNTRLIVALGAALAACDRPLSPDVARQTIEAHVRAVAPDVTLDSMAFPVTELVQIDEYSWEARFGEGETSGAMLLRRSSEGWAVAQYVDDATRDLMAEVATGQWLSAFEPTLNMINRVFIAAMGWENAIYEDASDPTHRRYAIATEFGPTRQVFDSIVAADGPALPTGAVLNYTSGSLSGAAVMWGRHPDRPEVQCGAKLSRQEYIGQPDLYWLASGYVACTNGTMSGSYGSKFDEVRAQIAVDGVLRP